MNVNYSGKKSGGYVYGDCKKCTAKFVLVSKKNSCCKGCNKK